MYRIKQNSANHGTYSPFIKTSSLCLYNYCSNNPVRYVDPDGEKIKIRGSREYKKALGFILQSLAPSAKVNMLTGVVSLNKKNSIGQHSKGTELIKSLIENKHTIIITMDDFEKMQATPANENDSYNPSKGTGSTISFSPNEKMKASVLIYDRGKAKVREFVQSPAIILGHELIHSLHFALGTRESKIIESYKDLTGREIGGGTKLEELKTIGIPGYFDENSDITENMLRQELFMNLRNEYEGYSN